jgi:hypothetical protein
VEDEDAHSPGSLPSALAEPTVKIVAHGHVLASPNSRTLR